MSRSVRTLCLLAACCGLALGGVASAAPAKPVGAAPMVPAGNAPVNFSGVWNKSTPGFRFSNTPPYQDWAQKKFDGLRPQDDPGSRCTYSSMPRIMISPYPIEIVQWPDHILLVSEFNGVIRRIWLDRKQHVDDLFPTYQGDSYGYFEGDVLVVHTTGFNGKNYLNPSGDLMSDAMSVVERWSIVKGPKPQLKIDFTFTDPKVYTKPFTGTLMFASTPELKLMESVCSDNNRNNPDLPGPLNFTSAPDPSPNYTPPAAAPK